MRVLVTGATGFLGRHVVSALAFKGAEVVAAVRSPGAAETLRASGTETRTCDLRAGDVRALVDGKSTWWCIWLRR